MSRLTLALTIAVALTSQVVFAQTFDEKFEYWPTDLKINGKIIVAGELEDPAILSDALNSSDRSRKTAILFDAGTNERRRTALKSVFEDNEQIEFVEFKGTKEQLDRLLNENRLVLMHGTRPLSSVHKRAILDARDAFATHIDTGGILVAVGSAGEFVSKFYLESDSPRPPEQTGLNLVPDCVIETNYTDSSTDQNRLLSVLAVHRRCVGIGLESNSALVLSGRKLRVAGDGNATFVLMANEREPLRVQTITASKSRRAQSEGVLLDLTQWRRDAIDRTLEPFPPAKPDTPFVEDGTLLIVGGGGLPDELMPQMVELAGGIDEARMVYIPCSESDDVAEEQRTVETWKKMGVKHATFIHTKDRRKANSDEKFLAPLKDATGLWFGGGRQWNMADSYYGTTAHRMMKDVLKRGGVIGGSSAGASIQARYLARATPIQNFRIMAFGYERGGLGFISGVAIDQHFSQRRRQKDMTRLVNKYPQILGIGIDEGTALIVQKSVAKVVGKGKVHFYDRTIPVYPDQPDYIALSKGAVYELAKRKVVKDVTEDTGTTAEE